MPRHTARYILPRSVSPVLPVLPDMTRQNAINAGIGIRTQAAQLQEQVRQAQIARTQSMDAKAQYQLQKEIETDRQKEAFYNGLQELESNLNAQGHKIGTQGHAEAFAAYAHEFPLARSTKDVQQTLKLHSIIADDQAALKQRMIQSMPPPEKIAQRYAKVQGDVTAFQALSKVEEAANIAKKLPNVPFSKASDLAGSLKEAALLEQSYPQLAQSKTNNSDMVQPRDIVQPVVPNTSVVTPTVAPTVAPVVDHTAAINWANANPNDPRAQVIIQRAQSALPQATQETTPQPDEEQ